jgi:hypothetical protein
MADKLIFAAGAFTFFLLAGGLAFSMYEIRLATMETLKSAAAAKRQVTGSGSPYIAL